jgi:hypothetical protein
MMMELLAPPNDVLRNVFGCTARDRWLKDANKEVLRRLEILEACGPYPRSPRKTHDLRCLRAKRAAWETYVFTAFACGMFEGVRGKELRGRLTSLNGDDFGSAMSECLACWFFAGKQHLAICANAPGRDKKNLDLLVRLGDDDVGVEVKAPFRERPVGRCSWHGDDSDKIAQALKAANTQFDDSCPNVLVLVPRLRRLVYSMREWIVHAAYGETMLTWQVNTVTGESGPTEVKFHQSGGFLNRQRPGGRPLKSDGFPAHRRISAIVCIEERFAEMESQLHDSPENEVWIEHDVLVLHNPFAYKPVSRHCFSQFPQLVPEGEAMVWTDGYEMKV